ncbi:unnamed protein product [Ectocarpus sp. 8 AP-2014]
MGVCGKRRVRAARDARQTYRETSKHKNMNPPPPPMVCRKATTAGVVRAVRHALHRQHNRGACARGATTDRPCPRFAVMGPSSLQTTLFLLTPSSLFRENTHCPTLSPSTQNA